MPHWWPHAHPTQGRGRASPYRWLHVHHIQGRGRASPHRLSQNRPNAAPSTITRLAPPQGTLHVGPTTAVPPLPPAYVPQQPPCNSGPAPKRMVTCRRPDLTSFEPARDPARDPAQNRMQRTQLTHRSHATALRTAASDDEAPPKTVRDRISD